MWEHILANLGAAGKTFLPGIGRTEQPACEIFFDPKITEQ